MKYEDLYKRINLECFYNSDFLLKTAEEVQALIKICNFIWICALDMYLWRIDRIKGHNSIFGIAGRPATKFSFLVHTQCEPLTIDQAERQLNKKKELDKGAFTAWPCRFNYIFRKHPIGDELPRSLWPMEYVEIPNDNGNFTRPAYRMRSGIHYLVINGIDRDSEYKDIRFPWNKLLE